MCMRRASEIQQIQRFQALAQYFTYLFLKRDKQNKKSSKAEPTICSQMEESRTESFNFNVRSEEITA